MIKPTISVVTGGCKPENWMTQYENFGENDVSWERVIVGPTSPNYTLPDNHRFIQSDVKPVQCFEVAVRFSSGEFIFQMPDDVLWRKNKRPLDILLETYYSQNNDNLVVSPRQSQDRFPNKIHDYSRDTEYGYNHIDGTNLESPMRPWGSFYRRKLHRDLGGYDSMFVALEYDIDMVLRILEIGGEIILSETYLSEPEKFQHMEKYVRTTTQYGNQDTEYLMTLWKIKPVGVTDLHRRKPVVPFKNYKILEVSQGPKGRW